MPDTSELACRTIEILEEHGWTKGQFVNPEGQYCLLGAIYTAAHEISESGAAEVWLATPLINKLTDKINNKPFKFLKSKIAMTYWNDQPERTKEEVIELLRSEC